MKLIRNLHRIYRPAVYQGRSYSDNYFEGWYFKLVTARGDHIWSVIPGVSFSDDPHSFVQLMHANSRKTHYIRFPLDAFEWERRQFRIRVGANSFSDRMVSLDLKKDGAAIKGELSLLDARPYPVRLSAPGIMGWYAYVPFMECYHGVVSMDHGLSGSLFINGQEVSFDGGKGYIEKDWGKSMPSDWIWVQSNHFEKDPRASFMLSLARIPWLKSHFPGFLSFLYFNGKVYRFATYNRSRITRLKVSRRYVNIEMENRNYRLVIQVDRGEGGVLKAPLQGAMEREIRESVDSTLTVVMKDRSGKLLFSDRGRYAGLEIVGDMEQYF